MQEIQQVGIAFHWYTGNHFENISLCRKLFPEKLLIHTEGCFSFDKYNSFECQYAHDILEDLNAGINGYIDWNLLLDSNGGPGHIKNPCNSSIILNNQKNDYIKRTSFYYIGHFSKFIQPGAKRIGFSRYTTNLNITAFKNPDDTIVMIIVNDKNNDIEVNCCMREFSFKDMIKSHSIITYLIKQYFLIRMISI